MSLALVRSASHPRGEGVRLFNAGAVDEFFGGYRRHGFEYEASAQTSLIKTFKKLAISQNWTDKQKEAARKKFHTAVDAEFSERVGKGFTLFEWQRLAKLIGIEPIPTTITQCRKVIAQENINIYQILQAYRRATEISNINLIKPCHEIQRFKTVKELRKYTKKHGAYFPKEIAKGSVLKGLLRRLH
ncbi:hypothetical protein ABW19_dt0201170 [Dactylella cylindrospora]|nr:hypothetical protein ABW19_dt0201170 [Dactylella cylindrospora]